MERPTSGLLAGTGLEWVGGGEGEGVGPSCPLEVPCQEFAVFGVLSSAELGPLGRKWEHFTHSMRVYFRVN